MEEKPIIIFLIGNFYFKVYLQYFTIQEQLDHSNVIIGRETCTPLTAAPKCIAFAARHGVDEIIKININGEWI